MTDNIKALREALPRFGSVEWFDWQACYFLLASSLPLDGAMWAAPLAIVSGAAGWMVEHMEQQQ